MGNSTGDGQPENAAPAPRVGRRTFRGISCSVRSSRSGRLQLCAEGRSRPSDVAQFAVAKFESEYGVDVLSIYDGPDQSWPLLRTHSGYGPEPEPVQSTSNSMFITFVTNGGQEMSGFDARYITLKQKPALAPELH